MSRSVARGVLALSIFSMLGLYLTTSRAGDSKPAKPAAESAEKDKPTNPGDAKTPAADSADNRAAVEKALASQTTLEFDDAPLRDVAAFLADKHGINVWLDQKNLADAGITPDTQVSINVHGITLRSALRLMLGEKEMNFIAEKEGLLITTDAKAKEHIETRIYDVSGFETLVTSTYRDPPPPNQDIIDLINGAISPWSWQDSGGGGGIASMGSLILVSQIPEVHDQIADMLTKLRMLRDEPQKFYGQGLVRVGQLENGAVSKLQAALKAHADFDFEDNSLSDLVGWLRSRGIETQLDLKNLADAGVTADTKFSFHAKGITIESGLNLLLRDKEMKAIIDHEVLLLTTDAKGKEKTVTEIYPVADLVSSWKQLDSDDDLVSVITSSVASSTWVQSGGSGTIKAPPSVNALVVSQTDDVHQQIGDLLTKLRAARRAAENSKSAHKNDRPPEPVTRIYAVDKDNEKGIDDYIATIRHLIAPDSWSNGKFYIGKTPGRIVVRQLPATQTEIAELLQELKATTNGGAMGGGAF